MISDFESRIIRETASDLEQADALTRAVEAGRPLAYLLGEWYFWRSSFKITPDCLIPRPDTERLVETAIELLPEGGYFADLCTGSGCIAISILGDRPDAGAVAVDVSSPALAVARENADRLGVSDRVHFEAVDLLSALPSGGPFDLIVANPPYIPTHDLADYPDLSAEPSLALDGGADGLIFYRRFTQSFCDLLKPGGAFIFEIGYDQADALRAIAADRRMDITIRRDYGGNDRVAILRPDLPTI